MKKHILVVLSVIICSMSLAVAEAKPATNSDLSTAIKAYKTGNYTQSYLSLNKYIEKDPSNALAYYYLAMSAVQLGKREEAVDNYDKVLSLTQDLKLTKYAEKGKVCITNPENCHEQNTASEEEIFIRGIFGSGLSKEARSDYEKQKIENLMREINRGKELEMKQFKDYKDFSYETPSNDEIVAALRTLQQAGLTNVLSSGSFNDLSLLTGNSNMNNNDMLFNLLTGSRNSSSLSPQVIQSLLTNQMSTGF